MIKGLEQGVISAFTGKKTFNNLAAGEPGSLLAALNTMVLDDQQLRRAPGYTLVAKVGTGPVYEQYDFRRSVDQQQFVFVHSGSSIYAMKADGSGLVELSTGETSAPHRFVSSAFACYSSNGVNAWRYVDVGGTLTKYKWGIDAPTVAPAITLGAGTLTLTYGRRYVYCYVSKYTDSLGIQRVSVSAPSPMSAYTGPMNAGVVQLTSLTASTDPQVGFIWIFAVTDSPDNTSATFFFEAEIANGTTSYGDTLPDSSLDQTRLAPFDNFAAPPAPLLCSFQSRIFGANGSLIQFSGYSEITLGIPEEAWPKSNFFNVPSGNRTVTAMIVPSGGTELDICTEDFWYVYTGYDATTFTEQDRVAAPGACGPLALCNTSFGVAFLSKSKRLWLRRSNSTGQGQPTDMSSGLAQKLAGTYAMDDIDAATIQNSVVRWFEFGSLNLICVFCRTSDAPDANLNLMQLWSIAVKSEASSGIYFGSSSLYEQISGIFETDKLPSVTLTNAAKVENDGEFYLYLGDASGNVYRFPDGFLDNGTAYPSSATLAWLLPREGRSRYYWIDLFTDRADAVSTFSLSAATADAPDPSLPLTGLSKIQMPAPVDGSAMAVRSTLQAPGLANGRYLSVGIGFPPNDSNDAVVRKVIVASAPLYPGAP